MYYNDIIIKFCERKLYLDRPEYINAISALYISGIGYYNLVYFYNKSKSITLVYICIISNGIGSFLFHWYAWYIFKLLDQFTMIIPLWLGINKILYDLEYSKMSLSIHTIYNISLLVLTVFEEFDKYFSNAFALEILLIFPLYYQVLRNNNIVINQQYLLNNKGGQGILLSSVSGLTWAITEKYCNKYLLFGHAVWHIGMSTGLCNIINYFYNNSKLIK